jgi:hypothetical protein
MLRIGDTIFSFDILEKKFACDLHACHGSCCRYGDSGAPLGKDEVQILEDIWTEVKPYLREKGVEAIEVQGKSVKDFENDWVTPLIADAECAYTIIVDGIYMCGIEKAWLDGKINFRKPLSCHLFPAKIKYYSDFRAVNYQEISICSPALRKGRAEGIYLFDFLKDPLIRALGKDGYKELCIAAKELRKSGHIR